MITNGEVTQVEKGGQAGIGVILNFDGDESAPNPIYCLYPHFHPLGIPLFLGVTVRTLVLLV